MTWSDMSRAFLIQGNIKLVYIRWGVTATKNDSFLTEIKANRRPADCHNVVTSCATAKGMREVSITTIRSGRRSSFGTSCIQCGSELIAPDASEYWGEYWSDAHVCHTWRCAKCTCRFESLVTFQADSKSRRDIKTGKVFPVAVAVSVGRIGRRVRFAGALVRSPCL